ncbi:MAG: hypothetical protein EPN85_14870 [Bacteroidetes bacterium]|nr:MAG: hypothetical protein EPN85_14870 [Bacteroidota bacterium]
MNTNQVITYLKNADSLLRIADGEVHRPSEDAVTWCTCQCTRKSVMELLRSFLSDKNYSGISENSLESLLQKCKKIDSEFNNIDIACFSCKTLDNDCVGGYCLEMEKVNECFEKAIEIREFVFTKLKVNIKDLE